MMVFDWSEIDLNRLKKALSLASPELRQALDNTIALIMEMIRAEAYRLAPKKTGAMARGIYWRRVEELSYELGCAVFYWIYQEFGTRYIQEKAFIRNAIYKYEGKIQSEFREKITEWLRSRGE